MLTMSLVLCIKGELFSLEAHSSTHSRTEFIMVFKCVVCNKEIDSSAPQLPMPCKCMLHSRCVMQNISTMDKCPRCKETTYPSETYAFHTLAKKGFLDVQELLECDFFKE